MFLIKCEKCGEEKELTNKTNLFKGNVYMEINIEDEGSGDIELGIKCYKCENEIKINQG